MCDALLSKAYNLQIQLYCIARTVYVYNAHCFCANNQQAFFLNETFKSNVAARFAQHEGVQVMHTLCLAYCTS